MNNEENSTLDTITKSGAYTNKNYAALPEVAYFRVQSRGLTKGKIDEDHTGTKERTVGAWALLVSCKDGKGLRLVGDVAYEHGMVIKSEFKTREQAIKAGKEYVEKWGKASAKKTNKAMETLAKQLGITVEEIVRRLAA